MKLFTPLNAPGIAIATAVVLFCHSFLMMFQSFWTPLILFPALLLIGYAAAVIASTCAPRTRTLTAVLFSVAVWPFAFLAPIAVQYYRLESGVNRLPTVGHCELRHSNLDLIPTDHWPRWTLSYRCSADLETVCNQLTDALGPASETERGVLDDASRAFVKYSTQWGSSKLRATVHETIGGIIEVRYELTLDPLW